MNIFWNKMGKCWIMFLVTFNLGNWGSESYVLKTFLSWYQNLNVSKINRFTKDLSEMYELVILFNILLNRAVILKFATIGLFSQNDLYSIQLLTWISRASCGTKPAPAFSVNLFHRDAYWHSVCIWHFLFLLIPGIDAKQLCQHLDLGAEGTSKVPERKEDKMLEIRLTLVPVKFQGCFVNSPADYWRYKTKTFQHVSGG